MSETECCTLSEICGQQSIQYILFLMVAVTLEMSVVTGRWMGASCWLLQPRAIVTTMQPPRAIARQGKGSTDTKTRRSQSTKIGPRTQP